MDEIIDKIKKKFINEHTEILDFDLSKIVFEEKVKLKCFQCKNYGVKHTCPPKINMVNYQKVFQECTYALLIKVEFRYTDSFEFDIVRTKSTNYLHKILLSMEKVFWENNNSMVISFIGGSCKLCKDGCDDEKCRHPESARIPWEATGVNIVKTLKESNNIVIDFSDNGILNRYGIIAW